MADRSLVVVRGAARSTDPTFACMAHDTKPGQYLLLEMDPEGSVVDRQILPASARADVERRMADSAYRGVHVDMRSDRSLLKLTPPPHAVEADLHKYRRAKSDEEMDALVALSDRTRDLLEKDGNFRGAASKAGELSAFRVTHAKGFTQYRGGLQDSLGRCSDVTRVVPKNAEWEARLERAYRGLDAIEPHLNAGVKVKTLNQLFMAHMKPEDVVYGDVVWHIGFESHEPLPCETLQEFDVVNTGVAVGNGVETAVLYRGARAIDMPTPPPKAEAPKEDAPYRSGGGEKVEDKRPEIVKCIDDALNIATLEEINRLEGASPWWYLHDVEGYSKRTEEGIKLQTMKERFWCFVDDIHERGGFVTYQDNGWYEEEDDTFSYTIVEKPTESWIKDMKWVTLLKSSKTNEHVLKGIDGNIEEEIEDCKEKIQTEVFWADTEQMEYMMMFGEVDLIRLHYISKLVYGEDPAFTQFIRTIMMFLQRMHQDMAFARLMNQTFKQLKFVTEEKERTSVIAALFALNMAPSDIGGEVLYKAFQAMRKISSDDLFNRYNLGGIMMKGSEEEKKALIDSLSQTEVTK